ncbi:hypothetical protein Cme02nite_66030 [Catellatospora methionotrophica]|uniref:Peptidase inhibitor family I36 n=1 Tax=Catellatospora methionotrophica TaxID=121620 RepID=A0A8J3PHV4_9ACTN|nr:hypothetical protein [Catellatospora methionotrophica]GIG18271.1 hypothetical protein Cme02nite_66030 [Catellatospora methionotrophica]
MRKLHRAATVIAALAIVGLAAPTAPAAAAEPVNQHCVAQANVDNPQAVCFDTFTKALQFASGGVLYELPKGSSVSARVDALNAGFGVNVVRTVISIEYTGSNYTGSDLIWTGTSGNCSTPTGNVDYFASSMPAGWDNVISSFKTYANCWDKHHENTNFGGASVGYEPSRSYIGGAMDNRTSSHRWS